MIHMSKGIDTALRIVLCISIYTIHYTRSSCCGCHFTRIQHIQRQCIVGLIARTISDRSSCSQTQFGSNISFKISLLTESRNNFRHKRCIETEIIEKEFCRCLCFEIPRDTFRKSGGSSSRFSGHAHCHIITRKHIILGFHEILRFVFFYPG